MWSLCLALSQHLLPGNWNEVHPCVRYEDAGYTIGAYLNSENAVSLYAGRVWRNDGWFCDYGLVTGYSAANVLPFGRCGREFETHRIFIAPAATPDDVGLVVGVEIFTR